MRKIGVDDEFTAAGGPPRPSRPCSRHSRATGVARDSGTALTLTAAPRDYDRAGDNRAHDTLHATTRASGRVRDPQIHEILEITAMRFR